MKSCKLSNSDRLLGMDRDITRRDFIHDLSLASLGLTLPAGVLAETLNGNPESASTYYPPIRTGMRGSHSDAFEAARALALEGRKFPNPVDLAEMN